ncbi:MAG: peptidoglycan-binding protein [Deltaproteobacteria bacterium]|nr:peptidoglycan-binding protein [Deltaproteobacteria bacterium]
MRIHLRIGLLLLSLWTVPALAAQPRGSRAVLARIETLVGSELEAWCRQVGLAYPPQAVLLRAFKKEREIEIWARNTGQERMRLLQTLPICALDADPGPKLRQGDHKTPEGFYYASFHYSSSNWYMWIKLEPEAIDSMGAVGDGSCFKIYIHYPNELDPLRSRAAGFRNTGGSIFAHGNCVTDGCISLSNRNFLYLFALARHHAPRHGRLQIHIFPFRFAGTADMRAEAARYIHLKALGEERLLRFWENLRQGYELFNQRRQPVKIRFGQTVLRAGDVSPDVIRLKSALKRNGFFEGEPDASFSPELEQAVRRFQKRKGLGVDGAAGPTTQRKLGLHWPRRYVFD